MRVYAFVQMDLCAHLGLPHKSIGDLAFALCWVPRVMHPESVMLSANVCVRLYRAAPSGEGCWPYIATVWLVSTLLATNKLFFTMGSRSTAQPVDVGPVAPLVVALVMVMAVSTAGTSTGNHRPGRRRPQRKCYPPDVIRSARETPGCRRGLSAHAP